MIVRKLPWPPKELQPNARVHWAVKAKATKKYKADCLKSLLPHGQIKSRDYFNITMYPPDNRRRDWDNMVASIKAAIDAISIAVGIDDSKLHYYVFTGDAIPNGELTIYFPERVAA